MRRASYLMGVFIWYALMASDLQAFGLNETIDHSMNASTGKYVASHLPAQSNLSHPIGLQHHHVFNSQALLVFDGEDGFYDFLPQAATHWTAQASYRQFLLEKKKRKAQVLVGTSDGMLHAIDAQTGVETFSFIPKNWSAQAHQLHPFDDEYRQYLPSPLVEADVYDKRPTTSATETGWRNIVVGTGGMAARSMFAIHLPLGLGASARITDSSTAGDVLWELNTHDAQFADLGHILQKPGVGVMRDGTWVVVAGNGYTRSGGPAKLFIINALTGAHVKTIDIPATGENGLGGVRLVMDLQRCITAAYAGDLQGNLWKFDFSGDNVNHWGLAFGGKPLFRAQFALRSRAAATHPRQAITATPVYMAHPRGGHLVVFGTGKWFQSSDGQDSNVQTLYAIWDRAQVDEFSPTPTDTMNTQPPGTSTMVSQTSLVEQTITPIQGTNFYSASKHLVNYADKRGWYINLSINPVNLRLVQAPQLAVGKVLLQTISPGGDRHHDASKPSPTTVLFVLNPFTGSASAPTFDVNADGAIDSLDTFDPTGHPINAVAVASNDSGDVSFSQKIGANGLSAVLTSNSGQTRLLGVKNTLRRSWRQIIRRPSPSPNTLDTHP